MSDLEKSFTTKYESDTDWGALAVTVVEDWVRDGLGVPEGFGTYIVWSCFILGNAKFLVSTTVADGRYFEVTLNIREGKIYLDTYKKTHNNQYDLLP